MGSHLPSNVISQTIQHTAPIVRGSSTSSNCIPPLLLTLQTYCSQLMNLVKYPKPFTTCPTPSLLQKGRTKWSSSWKRMTFPLGFGGNECPNLTGNLQSSSRERRTRRKSSFSSRTGCFATNDWNGFELGQMLGVKMNFPRRRIPQMTRFLYYSLTTASNFTTSFLQ